MKDSILSLNLRYLRLLANLSQRALAEPLGLKRNNVASYEAGIVEPRAATFIRIADFFNVEPENLLNVNLETNSHLINLPHQKSPTRKEESGLRPLLHLAERRGIEADKLLARLHDLQSTIAQDNGTRGRESELAELIQVLSDLMRESRSIFPNNRSDQRTS